MPEDFLGFLKELLSRHNEISVYITSLHVTTDVEEMEITHVIYTINHEIADGLVVPSIHSLPKHVHWQTRIIEREMSHFVDWENVWKLSQAISGKRHTAILVF